MDKKKQEEFLKLYEPIHDRFERFCRARVYGDMDYKDLMNETLLKAYQKFDTLRNKQAFLSFLFSISVRILANNNRKIKESVTDIDVANLQLKDHHNEADKSAEIYMLHKALAMLPDEQRESIILFEISGFSIKEIAKIQSASETAVRQRLRRGRLKLREILMPTVVSVNANKTGEDKL
ncbi:RNA polymerase sigma factor [Paracrocinitomix mangrovi]|uniref:RNA polymerase sigma factor n=1 Tax=Paracrocinitomix mangrovi TaxID=2862509 RepID=UPI001C8CF96E|nr:RNA polymerase sigma factor [Paracrocinitomix mangrovi]UKN02309.1 RNA polymerase sigma factor [Paracrocinitomix mangrovi]